MTFIAGNHMTWTSWVRCEVVTVPVHWDSILPFWGQLRCVQVQVHCTTSSLCMYYASTSLTKVDDTGKVTVKNLCLGMFLQEKALVCSVRSCFDTRMKAVNSTIFTTLLAAGSMVPVRLLQSWVRATLAAEFPRQREMQEPSEALLASWMSLRRLLTTSDTPALDC